MIWVRLILLPLMILSSGLAITWAAWNHEQQAARNELHSRFDFELRETVSRIEQRMAAYEQVLRGVQGLFAATGTIERGSFHDYFAALHLDANFSGIQGIGIIEWVPASRKQAHVGAMRRLGFSDYSIEPGGERENYAPTIQREPYTGRNRAPFGFDGWSEPVRRRAMEKARDSGMAAISGKVRLTVDSQADAQPGFVMYLPIYAIGQAQDNAARSQSLAGWIFASFRMNDLMSSLYGEQAPGLALSIYDGVEPLDAARLYHSPGRAALPAILSANEYLHVAGHTWMLNLSATDEFKTRFGRNAGLLIAVTGSGLSVLLALFAWLMATGRSRAMRLAATMTAELRISAVAFDSRESMMVTDANSVILRVNLAFTENTGYTPEEAVGQTPRLLKSGCHDADFYRQMWGSIASTGAWQGEVRDRRKNGEVYPAWLTISAVKGEGGAVTHYIGTHHDISERKKIEEKIEELAFFDPLTHLPNRTLLLDRLKQAKTAGNRDRTFGAVLFIDLDQFKTLNDTLGHDKGDLLLQQVAQRLTACLRQGDTVARLGGDEFVIVLAALSECAQESATQTRFVGEKILAALSKIYQLGSIDHRSTASIGATLFRGHETSIDDLLKQADLAMYKSKETGRNALRFFDPAMQTIVMQRAALESDLRKAIHENQFVLHYQAQMSGERAVTGAEVLVRWLAPGRGMISPAEFIPLAEETGLIVALGHLVLHSACSRLAIWSGQAGMADLTIAVNVSPKQFRESDFVAMVLAVMAQTGANPYRLKLELTESMLVDNVQDIQEKMYALQAVGVSFSLDDFGTGYSSLAYLKRLPLNQLKIDQSFVRDVLVDPNDAVIAKTIVELAQSLGLEVIAEGVETQAQLDFLAGSGCHAYQGYFFSRPLPVEDFEEFVRQS